MVRKRDAPPALLTFLIVVMSVTVGVAVGCGVDPARVADKRDGPNEGSLKEISLGGAYLPAGFGEGSLWVTDILTCDDTGREEVQEAVEEVACAFSGSMFLKRLNPQTGEVEAKVDLEDFFANVTEVAFGAGSVWVSSTDYGPGPVEERQPYDAVYRVDPETNQVVDRIPVDSPTGVDFGFGSVWVTSAGHGTLSRIDPETGEVAAKIKVGRGAVDVAVDERSGAVWVAGLYLPKDYDGMDTKENSGDNKLARVDPETNSVVAEIPVRPTAPDGGAQSVAVGGKAVWVASVDGRLFKVNPIENEVTSVKPLGDYFSDLKVSGGSVWATVQGSGTLGVGTQLKQMYPRTDEVVWTRNLGPVDSGGYGRLAADDGRIWFVEGGARPGAGTLARISS